MIKISKTTKRLGVNVQTLQKWDKKSILIAKRNPNNRRYYTKEQHLEYIGKYNTQNGKVIAYAKVLSRQQKDHLAHQIEFMVYTNIKRL